MTSSTKNYLLSIKEKQVEKFQNYANQNLADIKQLLLKHCPLDVQVIYQQIESYLENIVKLENSTLNLPSLELGLYSLILNNLSLYLGNLHQRNLLFQEVQKLKNDP